jgi:hypothetical protein
MKPALVLLLLLALSPLAEAGGLVARRLAGAPGTSVTLERGDRALVATAPQDPGSTEELVVAPPDAVTVTWLSGGTTVGVSVARQPGEKDEALAVRLARLVNALKVSFPVDPAPSGP